MKEQKMYVVVRRDLTVSQRAVQAGHALAEYLLKYTTDWTNGTLVYLRAENESDLEGISEDLTKLGLDQSKFNEPDMSGQLTAIACLGTNQIVRRIPLL